MWRELVSIYAKETLWVSCVMYLVKCGQISTLRYTSRSLKSEFGITQLPKTLSAKRKPLKVACCDKGVLGKARLRLSAQGLVSCVFIKEHFPQPSFYTKLCAVQLKQSPQSIKTRSCQFAPNKVYWAFVLQSAVLSDLCVGHIKGLGRLSLSIQHTDTVKLLTKKRLIQRLPRGINSILRHQYYWAESDKEDNDKINFY